MRRRCSPRDKEKANIIHSTGCHVSPLLGTVIMGSCKIKENEINKDKNILEIARRPERHLQINNGLACKQD